jgi:ABC-2 type transport system permease protein
MRDAGVDSVKSSQGTDRAQARELLRVFRKIEWRGSMNPITGKRVGALSGLLGIIAMNLFLSLVMAAVMVVSPDIQSAVVLVGMMLVFIISMQVMMEFGKTVIAPEDYSVIAPLPVSSRTFYIAKQIYFLSHVSILTLSLTLAPTISAIVISKSAFIGLEVLVVLWTCGIFAAQVVSIVYTILMRTVRPERLERILGYAQMTLSLTFTLMFVWTSRLKSIFQSLSLDSMPSLKLTPPYWFSAPFRLVIEGWQSELAVVALAGVSVLWAMYHYSANTLSLSYAQSLLQAGTSASPLKRKKHIPFVSNFWRRHIAPETRAILTLMRAQFRGDAAFQIQTVVLLPLVFLPVLFMWNEGTTLFDPFALDASSGERASNFYGPIFFVSVMMTLSVHHSSGFKAAWVFYTTPAVRRDVLTSARTIAWVIELGSLLLGLTTIFTYYFGNFVHALLHAIFAVSLMRIIISLAVLIKPGVPFSLSNSSGIVKFNVRSLLVMFPPIVAVMPLFAVEQFGYFGYAGYAAFLGASLLLGWALEKVTDPYLTRRFGSWEYLS